MTNEQREIHREKRVLEHAERMQKVLFPEGLIYEGEAFRTPVTCLFFRDLERSGREEYELVARTGFESGSKPRAETTDLLESMMPAKPFSTGTRAFPPVDACEPARERPRYWPVTEWVANLPRCHRQDRPRSQS